MNWIKLTCTGARRLPVWVNLERIVEIGLFMDEGSSLYPVVTRLYSGDVSASDEGSTYYHIDVLETPEQILRGMYSQPAKAL